MVELAKRVGKYVDTKDYLKTKNSDLENEGSFRMKRKHDVLEKDTGKMAPKGPVEEWSGSVTNHVRTTFLALLGSYGHSRGPKLIERGHLAEFVTNNNQPRLDDHRIE